MQAVFDFDSLFAAGAYSRLTGIAGAIGARLAYLLVIDPHPVDYFYRHFGRYPLAVIDTLVDTEADYLAALDHDPGGSAADAMNSNSNRVAIVFDTPSFALYGERARELIIAAGSTSIGAARGDFHRRIEAWGAFDDRERALMLRNYR